MSTEQDLIQDENNEEVYEKLTFMVDKGQEPMRIDKWVQMRIEGMTRSKLQNGIEGGFLTVNGKVVKSNYKTRPGRRTISNSSENTFINQWFRHKSLPHKVIGRTIN